MQDVRATKIEKKLDIADLRLKIDDVVNEPRESQVFLPDERMDLSMGLLTSFYASSGIGCDAPSCRASWLSATF